ncbi:uncharacterized protein SPAPADRAFT_57736 [Spathaspora passalidarum NRRL Y-27907]|uniref:DUF7082 domain-containing protein n=1 Tax=Spathaspora passalidarum (strain NRRL Y-27907 / 11-Y1) TaxID=619300 RepID=G3ADW3_SPAPN|nr:uncharacterized protein SPAPADRAFT_57736 [Spathaspora passalidarum NRRL Y-27907]EGW34687.1 hypothetical protein SPAPADRAFT_57736 [Spathaspora passalidarum NRRL Y-27907]
MLTSTTPNYFQSNRFDMLDPNDPNPLNEFSLVMNTGNTYPLEDSLDDAPFVNYITNSANYSNTSNGDINGHAFQTANVNLGISYASAASSLNSSNSANVGPYYGGYEQQQPQQQQTGRFNQLSNMADPAGTLYTSQPHLESQFSFTNQKLDNAASAQSILTTNSTPITGTSDGSSSIHSLFDSTSNSLAYNNYYPSQQMSNGKVVMFDVPQHYSAPNSSTFEQLSYNSSSPPPVSQVPQPPRRSSMASTYYTPVKSEGNTDGDNGSRRYRVVRGVSAGGCTTRPPKESMESDSTFLPVELSLMGASVEDICYPKWSKSEKDDRRRIIRIERIQNGPKLIANFSIVGGANENPITLPAPPNVDVVEVSCLECNVRPNDDSYDSQSSDDEGGMKNGSSSPKNYVKSDPDGDYYQYYITSVEVVEIVELLIGTQTKDPAEKRRERGRVRSNLVPFWSKKPISSRMHDNAVPSSSSNPSNHDFRIELAKRIMGYEIRKPRGFDKEVRILRWDKLVPALKRALQSYYTEIPKSDSHLKF